jgi:imidazolonepropionase
MSFSPPADGVWRNLRLANLRDTAAQALPSCIVVRNGMIEWLGPETQIPAAQIYDLRTYNARGAWATPGLIDCHTHLVYAGNRANEFAMRLEGASYADIARAGGGIVSTVRATREASEEELFKQSAKRLEAILSEGVCAIEIKSGYGLSLEAERKQLRVARALGAAYDVTVKTTFLGAHALPPEYAGRADGYIDLVCDVMMPALIAEGLVDAVDAFCETIGFTRSQTERVFRRAQSLGVPVKLHAEQLSDMDGAALASDFRALSCDHLEWLSQSGIEKMRAAGTTAVLLPGAFYALRETRVPPIAALRAAGVPMAIATDHNPGTSPCLSLLLAMNMACTLFKMTVTEALAGVTEHAARALGLQATHGTLRAGTPANFVLWNVSEPSELAYWFGNTSPSTIVRNGRLVRDGLRHE